MNAVFKPSCKYRRGTTRRNTSAPRADGTYQNSRTRRYSALAYAARPPRRTHHDAHELSGTCGRGSHTVPQVRRLRPRRAARIGGARGLPARRDILGTHLFRTKNFPRARPAPQTSRERTRIQSDRARAQSAPPRIPQWSTFIYGSKYTGAHARDETANAPSAQ